MFWRKSQDNHSLFRLIQNNKGRLIKNQNLADEVNKEKVEMGVNLIHIVDFNGRLDKLEQIRKDNPNGKMVKRWMDNDGLTLLYKEEIYEGKYTYNEKGGKRANGYILVNLNMLK